MYRASYRANSNRRSPGRGNSVSRQDRASFLDFVTYSSCISTCRVQTTQSSYTRFRRRDAPLSLSLSIRVASVGSSLRCFPRYLGTNLRRIVPINRKTLTAKITLLRRSQRVLAVDRDLRRTINSILSQRVNFPPRGRHFGSVCEFQENFGPAFFVIIT